jgi:hypothetical protein
MPHPLVSGGPRHGRIYSMILGGPSLVTTLMISKATWVKDGGFRRLSQLLPLETHVLAAARAEDLAKVIIDFAARASASVRLELTHVVAAEDTSDHVGGQQLLHQLQPGWDPRPDGLLFKAQQYRLRPGIGGYSAPAPGPSHVETVYADTLVSSVNAEIRPNDAPPHDTRTIVNLMEHEADPEPPHLSRDRVASLIRETETLIDTSRRAMAANLELLELEDPRTRVTAAFALSLWAGDRITPQDPLPRRPSYWP